MDRKQKEPQSAFIALLNFFIGSVWAIFRGLFKRGAVIIAVLLTFGFLYAGTQGLGNRIFKPKELVDEPIEVQSRSSGRNPASVTPSIQKPYLISRSSSKIEHEQASPMIEQRFRTSERPIQAPLRFESESRSVSFALPTEAKETSTQETSSSTSASASSSSSDILASSPSPTPSTNQTSGSGSNPFFTVTTSVPSAAGFAILSGGGTSQGSQMQIHSQIGESFSPVILTGDSITMMSGLTWIKK